MTLRYEFVSAYTFTDKDGHLITVGKARINGHLIGVTVRVNEELVADKEAHDMIVRDITRREAVELYRREWWRPFFWNLRAWLLGRGARY